MKKTDHIFGHETGGSLRRLLEVFVMLVLVALFCLVSPAEVKADIDIDVEDGQIKASVIKETCGENDIVWLINPSGNTVLELDDDLLVAGIRTATADDHSIITDLTIKGSKTLEVSANSDYTEAIAKVKNLTIESGKIIAYSRNDNAIYFGSSDINNPGGTFNVKGGSVTAITDYGTAIFSFYANGMNITGGIVKVEGNRLKDDHTNAGMLVNGTLVINGGTVDVVSYGSEDVGIRASYKIEITKEGSKPTRVSAQSGKYAISFDSLFR